MANHLGSIFAKLNVETNCSLIEKDILVKLCVKYERIKIIHIQAYKSTKSYLNYSVEILQHKILHIKYNTIVNKESRRKFMMYVNHSFAQYLLTCLDRGRDTQRKRVVYVRVATHTTKKSIM